MIFNSQGLTHKYNKSINNLNKSKNDNTKQHLQVLRQQVSAHVCAERHQPFMETALSGWKME